MSNIIAFLPNALSLHPMGTFDNSAFTEKVAALYAKQLMEHLPGVKFQIAHKATLDLTEVGSIRLLGKSMDTPRTIVLDYVRGDTSIDEDTGGSNISSVMSQEIIACPAGT
jgi:hypothetical protein